MKPEMKKLIIANLPYLLFVYLFGKLGQAYRLAEGIDLSQKLLHFADGCAAAFESAAPSFNPFDLLIGVAGAAALRLMVYCKGKNAKKYRKGVEYGSARWGGPKDIAPYIDPNFDNNILLTQTERLTMNNRPKDPKTARNKNVLVIGGSGSGKTRFFVKPNLMQCVSKDYPTSFVITDPKGSLIGEVGQLLIRSGYRVKVLNTINFSKSMKYNPFRYLHSEKDVLKLVNTLICNTKGEGEKSAEDFWVKSERLFYTALIGYIWQEAPEEEMNFTTLLEMINASEAREDDPEFQSPVDLMFERLEERDPDHFAVRQYKKFLLSAGKTRSSILISAGARMAPFDIREVRELMEDDELELDTIGDEKTALFLIMSDTDTTFNFILAMVQSQLINLLCDRADDKYGGRLPVHVRMILDEFANIGQITFPASSPTSVSSNCPVTMSWNRPTLQILSNICGRKSRNRRSRKSTSDSSLQRSESTPICSSLTLTFSGSLWIKFISPRFTRRTRMSRALRSEKLRLFITSLVHLILRKQGSNPKQPKKKRKPA